MGLAAAVHERLTSEVAPFDVVLLATQPPDVEEATRSVRPWLREDGQLVCLQNGLCEERLLSTVDKGQLVSAVVSWGASMLGPGHYAQTAGGAFTLGSYFSGEGFTVSPRVTALLRAAFPVRLTQNLRGVRWSKLAVNSVISTLGTIAGLPLGALLKHALARRLALEIATEVLQVARAEGVELEPVAKTVRLERLELATSARSGRVTPTLLAQHLLVCGVGLRYRRMRSSMLAAIERGRAPAVDFLNGEVVARARKHGIAAPVNSRAVELVWDIARRERSPSLTTLTALYDETR